MRLNFRSMQRVAWLSAIVIGLSFGGTATAGDSGKTFDEIMQSISQQGALPNGDGHRWTFRQTSDGGWEVQGARGRTARVTEAGSGGIEIEGFPHNWGANGRYEFSGDRGKCRLRSKHSNHRLKWKC